MLNKARSSTYNWYQHDHWLCQFHHTFRMDTIVQVDTIPRPHTIAQTHTTAQTHIVAHMHRSMDHHQPDHQHQVHRMLYHIMHMVQHHRIHTLHIPTFHHHYRIQLVDTLPIIWHTSGQAMACNSSIAQWIWAWTLTNTFQFGMRIHLKCVECEGEVRQCENGCLEARSYLPHRYLIYKLIFSMLLFVFLNVTFWLAYI